MGRKVLVVDDEKLIVKGIKFSLEQDGMEVDCAYDGEAAIEMIQNNEYDIVLLDLMLPKKSGFEVCQIVRGFSEVPIIMLTAKGEDINKILGLEYGADDYITKPFNILEVKARIKTILKRSQRSAGSYAPEGTQKPQSASAPAYDGVGFYLDKNLKKVYIDGTEISLTTKEFDLIELLSANKNKVFSREDLMNIIWGFDNPGDARTVDVHIRRLREKIEKNPSTPKYVQTKWGAGYYFNDN